MLQSKSLETVGRLESRHNQQHWRSERTAGLPKSMSKHREVLENWWSAAESRENLKELDGSRPAKANPTDEIR